MRTLLAVLFFASISEAARSALADSDHSLAISVAQQALPVRVPPEQTATTLVHPKVTLRGKPASPGSRPTRSCLGTEPSMPRLPSVVSCSHKSDMNCKRASRFPCAGSTRNSVPYLPHLLHPPRQRRIDSTWLVRSYLRRPPEGHRWGYGMGSLDRHLQPTFFHFQRRAPTSRAAIGFPPRLAPRVRQRIPRFHAETTHFGQTPRPSARRYLSRRNSRAEPSDTPSLMPAFPNPGGPFQPTSAKNTSPLLLMKGEEHPRSRVPSPPGTLLEPFLVLRIGHRSPGN